MSKRGLLLMNLNMSAAVMAYILDLHPLLNNTDDAASTNKEDRVDNCKYFIILEVFFPVCLTLMAKKFTATLKVLHAYETIHITLLAIF